MPDYRIEITSDEGAKLPPILFNDADTLDFEALRQAAELLGRASNVRHAHLMTGGEPADTPRVLFCRSDEEPSLPVGDALGIWTDDVPDGNAPAWTTSALYRGGNRRGDWSPVQRLS